MLFIGASSVTLAAWQLSGREPKSRSPPSPQRQPVRVACQRALLLLACSAAPPATPKVPWLELEPPRISQVLRPLFTRRCVALSSARSLVCLVLFGESPPTRTAKAASYQLSLPNPHLFQSHRFRRFLPCSHPLSFTLSQSFCPCVWP